MRAIGRKEVGQAGKPDLPTVRLESLTYLILSGRSQRRDTVTMISPLVGTVYDRSDVLKSRKRLWIGFPRRFGAPPSSSSDARTIRALYVPSGAPFSTLPLCCVRSAKLPSGPILPSA